MAREPPQWFAIVWQGIDMGDTSLIRTTLLVALLTALGLVAAGRAPAAEPPTIADESAPRIANSHGNAAISFPPP
jgi:hypothetical protein